MAIVKENEKHEEPGFSQESAAEDIVAGFIRNNRKPLFALLAVIAAGIIGFVAAYTVRDALSKKAIARVDEYARRVQELGGADSTEADALLEELNAFAPGSFGYAAAKAYSLAAGLYAERKDWAKAEEAWLASSQKAPKTFFAPFSLYNAAVAAEEQGNLDNAVDYHLKCIEYGGLNPAAARSQFSIGRIRESQNNREAALEAYRKVIESWPDDATWANLAQSRIIGLDG
jgi:tetratricopeptide (TPR) repeat protein